MEEAKWKESDGDLKGPKFHKKSERFRKAIDVRQGLLKVPPKSFL